MSRELRRVPADWEHPRDERRKYIPLFDIPFVEAQDEWDRNRTAWHSGTYQYQRDADHDDETYVRWCGRSPDPDDYRPHWLDEERTHFQVYETVTEGTPISPVLDSVEAVIRWWMTVGDNWGTLSRDAAERWVDDGGSVATFIKVGDVVLGGAQALDHMEVG